MKSRKVAIIVLLLMDIMSVSAANFATKRLQNIAQCLALSGLEQLDNQTSYDYRYRQQKLVVRANRYGEIEHIGLALFPEDLVRQSPVYDFLERDLLERQLPNLDGELQHKLKNEHLTFVTGSVNSVLSFNGSEQFAEERIDLKQYRVTWTREGREVLKISFDMDIEMLSGCNAIELEEQFLRRLKRHRPVVSPDEIASFPSFGDTFVVRGDSFLIREMRNDLYFERNDSGWHLCDNPEATSKMLPNLMLSTQFEANPVLDLTMDQYGYGTEKATVSYKNLFDMAIEDGCTPYFGIKERREDGSYTGVLMLVNRRGGYAHMLSAAIPAKTISNRGAGSLSGRLYVYIPLHNVSDRFFQTRQEK